MPLVRSVEKPTDVVFDSYGNELRADWEPVEGRPGLWHTPGETHGADDPVYSPGDPALMAGYASRGGSEALLGEARGNTDFRGGTRSFHVSGEPQPDLPAYGTAAPAPAVTSEVSHAATFGTGAGPSQATTIGKKFDDPNN